MNAWSIMCSVLTRTVNSHNSGLFSPWRDVHWTDVVRQLSGKTLSCWVVFYRCFILVLLLLFGGKVGERLTVSPQLWRHPCCLRAQHACAFRHFCDFLNLALYRILCNSVQDITLHITYRVKVLEVYHFKNTCWDSPWGPFLPTDGRVRGHNLWSCFPTGP